jgi:hypothetical protein
LSIGVIDALDSGDETGIWILHETTENKRVG